MVSEPSIQTTIRVTNLKRSGGDLTGNLQIIANIEGLKTGAGNLVHQARFNLSSSQTRNSLAKMLTGRSVGVAKDVDWFDGLEMLCQQVMAAEARGQPFETVGSIAVPRDAQRYAIDPLVPAHVASLMYGPGGSGKSVLALALALSIQVGREIVPGLHPCVRGPVMYLDWETDRTTITDRVQRISAGCGIPAPNILYRRCMKPLHEDAEYIAGVAAENGIVYAVIDSVGMAMGGAGEHSDANEGTLRLFDAVRHIGVSTQLIDHVSKAEMKTATGKALMPYGSIFKINLCRSAWEIRNTAHDNEDLTGISLVHAKSNDSRLYPQIDLEIGWNPDSGAISFEAAEFTLESVTPQGTNRTQTVIEYLRKVEYAYPTEIATATGIPAGTVRVLLSDHKRKDYLNFSKREFDGRYGLAVDAQNSDNGSALHAATPVALHQSVRSVR